MKLCRTSIYIWETPFFKIFPGKTTTIWSWSHLFQKQNLHWYLTWPPKISLLQGGESNFFNACVEGGNTKAAQVALNPKCEFALEGCPGTPACPLSRSHHWHRVHSVSETWRDTREVTIYQGATSLHETGNMSNKRQYNKADTGGTCFSSCVICLCFLGQEKHI